MIMISLRTSFRVPKSWRFVLDAARVSEIYKSERLWIRA